MTLSRGDGRLCLPNEGPRQPLLVGEEQVLLRLNHPVWDLYPEAHALDVHCAKVGSLGSGLLGWMPAWLTHSVRPVQGHPSHLSPAGTPVLRPLNRVRPSLSPATGMANTYLTSSDSIQAAASQARTCPLAHLTNPGSAPSGIRHSAPSELGPRHRTAPLRSARGGSLVGRPLVWRPGPAWMTASARVVTGNRVTFDASSSCSGQSSAAPFEWFHTQRGHRASLKSSCSVAVGRLNHISANTRL